jgi:hypothetical protein
LLPNAELDGDTGAAFAVCVSDATAISEVNARAAINILMTHLHVAEHCRVRRIKMTIALPLPVRVRYSVIVFLYGVALADGRSVRAFIPTRQ